jgi:hypothetical protein
MEDIDISLGAVVDVVVKWDGMELGGRLCLDGR